MWNIKKINEQTKLNTKTDTENRLVVTRGEGAVGGQNRRRESAVWRRVETKLSVVSALKCIQKSKYNAVQ